MFEDLFLKDCLVLGCGNPLLGDDGFGPAVIDHLISHFQIPQYMACIDVGTSISGILFDLLLSEIRPRRLILIDAVDRPGKKPGEIFEMQIDDFPPAKTANFLPHQFPSVNMLREIRDFTDVDLRILAVQIDHIPDEVHPGLSPAVAAAVLPMCRLIMKTAKEAA